MTHKKRQRPSQLDELFPVIRNCLENGQYRLTKHAIDRQTERAIDLPDVLYVLRTGYHERQKTTFDETFQCWKYAIRGKTVDDVDVRIIIAFDPEDMLIITVMRVITEEKS